MIGFLLRRLAAGALTLLALLTLSFFLIRAAPGGPFDAERPLEPELRARLEAQYRLDQPLWRQYLAFLADLARGELGPSLQYREYRVAELIREGWPVSLRLGSAALLLAVAAGLGLGVLAAWRRDRLLDRLLMALATLLQALPVFVSAPLLVLLFALTLGWLPAGGYGGGALRHLVLPVTALALPHLAIVARLTRTAMVETLAAEFVRAARARGLSETRILLVHALRPALVPVVAYLGPAAAAVLTGSVVVEQTFGLPGVGRYFVQGALNRDYTLVMGVVLLVGALVILLSLLADLLAAWLDPRIRLR
ncbi:MAG: ABC transporter permease subunit [Xanthomonadales bacterium]|nr:ABC transporter permease subunit [Xanthomonadales bacterium]